MSNSIHYQMAGLVGNPHKVEGHPDYLRSAHLGRMRAWYAELDKAARPVHRSDNSFFPHYRTHAQRMASFYRELDRANRDKPPLEWVPKDVSSDSTYVMDNLLWDILP